MSMNGDRTIIKKVPVSANYNEMIIDQNIYTFLPWIGGNNDLHVHAHYINSHYVFDPCIV